MYACVHVCVCVQVLVKPEHLLPEHKPALWTRDNNRDTHTDTGDSASGSGDKEASGNVTASDSASGSASGAVSASAKKKGSKRPRDARPDGKQKLCGQSRKGEPCSFGDSCRFR